MDSPLTTGNIGDDGQTHRLRRGIAALSIALTMAVAMLKMGASTPVRLILVLPFLVAAHGFIQGLYRT